LEIDSEVLERISDDFKNTLALSGESEEREASGMGKIKIASFAEELSLTSLAAPIVNTRSAFIGLPDEITETIWAHHRDLCRFGDEFDAGYNRISRRIVEFVADASSEIQFERSRPIGEVASRAVDMDERDLGTASREDTGL
jgi:hypothetical protein